MLDSNSKGASMAIVLPFRSVRPVKEYVANVASQPYDVINSEEAKEIAKDNALSFLHVTKSEIDLPVGTSPYSEEVYQKARQNFVGYLRNGVLFQDRGPEYYVYCQKKGSHEQCGIGACVHISEFDLGNVKRHEMTLPEKEADRTRHIDTVNAQTGPVFLTYRSNIEINRLVEKIKESIPEYDFETKDGVKNRVWVVGDKESIRKIRKAFRKVERLYIADGHHRAASGVAVAKRRLSAAKKNRMRAPFNLILAVLFPHNEVKIRDYNRVVKDLSGLDATEFIKKIQEKFFVDADYFDKSPQGPRQYGMYLEGKWYRLRAKDACIQESDIVGSLDVSILQDNLLGPLLGIQDPRSDKRIHFVGAARGIGELERMVDSGKFRVAFSLYPPTVDQMMAVADAGEMMPPKSTWFEPKLMDGIMVHILDEETKAGK